MVKKRQSTRTAHIKKKVLITQATAFYTPPFPFFPTSYAPYSQHQPIIHSFLFFPFFLVVLKKMRRNNPGFILFCSGTTGSLSEKRELIKVVFSISACGGPLLSFSGEYKVPISTRQVFNLLQDLWNRFPYYLLFCFKLFSKNDKKQAWFHIVLFWNNWEFIRETGTDKGCFLYLCPWGSFIVIFW